MLNQNALSVLRKYGFAPIYLESFEEWRVIAGGHRLCWLVDSWSKRVRYVQYYWGMCRRPQIVTSGRPMAGKWVREFIEVATSRQFRLGNEAISLCRDSANEMRPSFSLYQPDGDLLIPHGGYASLQLQKTAAPKVSDLERIIDGVLRYEDIPEGVVWDAITDHYCTST